MPSQIPIHREPHWFSQMVLLSLVTLLFWEWLRPLAVLTDTHSLPIFLLFFVFVLALRVLHLPWYINGFLISLILFYILHYLYFYDPFFSKEWLFALGENLIYSFTLLIQWDVGHISFEVKTLLFLLFIWYVASYLFETKSKKRNMLAFFLTTIVYLATLDTFTPYQAQASIIRTVICGLLLLAMLQLSRVIESGQFQITNKRSTASIWVVSSIFIIAFVSILGVLAPKAGPSWPDPLSFMQAYSDGGFQVGAGSSVQKVGYGDSDDLLGGGFVQDDSIAFYAITEERQYWRGESKDFYNGRGWEHSDQRELYLINPQTEPANLVGHPGSLLEDGVVTETIESRVFFAETPFSNLFYPGDVRTIDVYPKDAFLQLEPISGRFTSWNDDLFSKRKVLEEYILETDYPSFSVRSLKEANRYNVSQELQSRYTQLPDELPQRVGDLAEELTASLDNPYDKVKEVESYFRRQGYRYETQDVPIPGPGEDYVDQFIFETRRGYCDNFSSAMVVMLRTVDIPARWVKGFTSGEVIESNEDSMYTTVRNKNAHSWVEVYFPGTGWVPFEPTRSFINPYTFERDIEAENIGVDQEQKENEEAENQAEEQDALEKKEEKNELDLTKTFTTLKDGFVQKMSWKVVLWILISLTSILIGLFYWRYAILAWMVGRYKRRTNNKSILKGYELLISYLGMIVLKRKPSQTIREYVQALESHFETKELKDFTKMFEEVRYGGKKDS